MHRWLLRKPARCVCLTCAASRPAAPRTHPGVAIVVQGADIDGVMLTADSGAVISGEVVAENGGPLPASSAPMRVTTQLAIPSRAPSPAVTPGEDDGSVRPDGSFSRKSPSEAVIVRASPLPRGWAIKRIEIGGRDHADVPVELGGGQRLEGVKVVITNRFPSVAGRISDGRGAPADGTIILFPADAAKWLESAGSARSARPDQSGMYHFESVRPGEYLLVALDTVQQWQVYAPEFLEQLRERAAAVTLSQDDAATVNLTLKR